MKLRFILLIFLFSTSLLFAQDFRVTFNMDSVGYLNQNSQLALGGYVHNVTSDTITVSMFREQSLPAGWTTSLCFGNCLPPQFERIEDVKVPPQDSLLYDITFNSPKPSSEEAKAQLSFWDGASYVQYWFTASTEPTFSAIAADTMTEVNAGENVFFDGMLKNTCKRQRVYKMFDVTGNLAASWTLEAGFGFGILAPNSREVILAAGDSIDFYIQHTTDGNAEGSSTTHISIADTFLNYTYSQDFKATILPPPFTVTVADTAADTLAGQSHGFSGYVYNNSDKALTVFMVREQNNIPTGWSTTLCFGTCPQSTVDTVSPLIMNGDSLEYIVTFYSDETPADGDVHIMFYANGEADTVRQNFSLHTTSTAIGDTPGNTISNFELLGNYPNPFNPTTQIGFSLPVNGFVAINIYNILGQKVKTLINENVAAGKHLITWNGKDSSNNNVSSGIYFYRMTTNNYQKTSKMLIVK